MLTICKSKLPKRLDFSLKISHPLLSLQQTKVTKEEGSKKGNRFWLITRKNFNGQDSPRWDAFLWNIEFKILKHTLSPWPGYWRS